ERRSTNAVSNRVSVDDPARGRDAVRALFAARYPGTSFADLARAFDDFGALYEGKFPGYLACDTLYHDVRHSLDITLAMARLIDGHERVCAAGGRLRAPRGVVGL